LGWLWASSAQLVFKMMPKMIANVTAALANFILFLHMHKQQELL
jgi:hypothetical protein